MNDTHTISMGGCKYTWEDFDEDAEQLDMNRSQFVQYLYIGYKDKKKFFTEHLYEIISLLLLAMVLLLLVMRV